MCACPSSKESWRVELYPRMVAYGPGCTQPPLTRTPFMQNSVLQQPQELTNDAIREKSTLRRRTHEPQGATLQQWYSQPSHGGADFILPRGAVPDTQISHITSSKRSCASEHFLQRARVKVRRVRRRLDRFYTFFLPAKNAGRRKGMEGLVRARAG